jgi:hypothetical protein
MLGIMTARCNQCGHDNNPEYRFCGICGAPLQPAIATREPGRERASSPVSGPSFLGLGDERSRDLDYLLEDEPPRGHARLYLALLLLLLSSGLLAWHWQRDGFPWAGLVPKPAVRSTPANSAPDAPPAPGPVVLVPPTGNSVPPEAQAATAAGAGETTPAVAMPPAESAPSPAPAVTTPEATLAPKDGPDSAESAAKPATPLLPATTVPPPSAPASTSPDETQNTEIPSPKAAAPAPIAKAAVSKPSPTTPPVSFDDRLVADGERYLYGRGVPEDCARAQRNLQIGAGNSNPKAQTLLGAMYATGHCVGRDLPTAYRWFAKALHGDPGNSRVQRDLEVLWKQMTPEERQLAMKSR